MQNSNEYKPGTNHRNLYDLVPAGLVMDRKWLSKHGVDRPLTDYYIRSGKLKTVARGAYRRPGPPLKWEQIVYSLLQLGFSIYVGGRSALEYFGLSHYLPISGRMTIELYRTKKLPAWVKEVKGSFRFRSKRQTIFDSDLKLGLTTKPFGSWDWLIPYAMPERAFLEMLSEIQEEADFETVDKLFEGAGTLRPDLLQQLLEACNQVKAKRLFLWYAERHSHVWFSNLHTSNIDLGVGKRQIIPGGKLDRKYSITVPKRMDNGLEMVN